MTTGTRRRATPAAGPGPAQQTLLRAESASRSFGEVRALVDADLTIDGGESVAIMGPSGSGQTTLLHVLAGIITADRGRVLLRGPHSEDWDDIAALSDDERSALRLRRFGFVFQQGFLLPELTAEENVALPLLLTGAGRAPSRDAALAGLDAVGLGGLGNRRIGRLSGGQVQRVAIARALIADPSMVFADEPTGSLDSHTAASVLELLLDAARTPDRALVVVTHDPQVAARCDRVVRLRDGRIEESS